ncbi:Sec-independent protein translocase protein TatB [Sandarakinorhabdus sp.]|uniref:Sec-independent protein translocase protein TatB n=1 Tax=Sandarakinorhabdus sp. TaxID=1916663 RepID=UPI0033414BD0
MFGIDSSELLVIGLVALLVIGPKDLPKAMRWVGQWVAKGRAMSRHLRSGFDAMMRETELEEMQKLWAAQNEAIMKATALPENSLPNLAGPVATDTSYDPWPTVMLSQEPPADQDAVQAVDLAKPAPAKRPRKPRAKKIVVGEPALDTADAATPQSDAA